MDGTALIVRGRTAEDVLKLLRGDRLIALAIAIADGSARSDIEISAYRESLHPAEYDLTRPADDKEDVQVAQRAARYIRERGDVWPWRMVEVDGNPNLVRFVERDSKTDDDGMCYCQEGVVCPACEAPAKPGPIHSPTCVPKSMRSVSTATSAAASAPVPIPPSTPCCCSSTSTPGNGGTRDG